MGLLIHAVYLSEVNIASGDLLRQVRAIHEVALRRNGATDVSGALLFSDRFFVQVLEGPRMAVTETLGRILADPRHDNIRLSLVQEVTSRMFGNWSMRLVNGASAFRVMGDQRTFDPSLATASELLDMLVRGCLADAGNETGSSRIAS
jgi:hypothetical protein